MAKMSGRRLWVPSVLGAALVVAAGVAWAVQSSSDPMIDIAPPGVIAEADIPEALRPLYTGAVANSDVFASTPCYCGCMDMLGHRHLLDCFQRPDGSGWEAHAVGCGVCLGEARQVIDLLAAGSEPDEVVAAVVAEWSDPYLEEE